MKGIFRIEPRKYYDKAIVRKLKSGKLIYSYYKLIKITKNKFNLSEEGAEEWVDYNICGLNDCSHSLFGICYK